VAGFNQAYRGLISESVAGAAAGATFESWSVALDQKFPTGTYLGVEAEFLNSDVDRTLGTLDSVGCPPRISASGTAQSLDYKERNVTATVNQLIGKRWAAGARYRWTRSQLETRFPEIPISLSAAALGIQEARLHQVNLYASYSHDIGFFGLVESAWFHQANDGYSPVLPGEDFWQFNLFGGYRFHQRAAEVRLGILNFTDRNYRLNPLNFYYELPRERTWTASFRFNF